MSRYFDPKTNKFQPLELAIQLNSNMAVGPDRNIWVYDKGVWRPEPEAVEKACVRLLGNEFTPARATTVERIVRHMKSTRQLPETPVTEAWEPYINLSNCMYNWRHHTEEEHHQDFLSTVQLPIEFDEHATCPNFDAWLEEVAEPDMIPLLWEVIGYLLMTGNPMHTAFVLVGPGGTGKSTFLRVLERLIGRENITAQSLKSLSESRFATSHLFGKTANILGDIDAGYLKDSSTFKAILGGDTVFAEEKGKKGFEFRPFAVPIFSANKTWRSADDTDGYFRRWIVLPFEKKVDRSKPFDEAKLYAEASGIFNRAMTALRDMYGRTSYDAHGNEVADRQFDIRGSVREARERFMEDSDPIRMWLHTDELVMADAGNERLRQNRTEIYARYVTWCKNNGIKAIKSGPEFYASLRALNYRERKIHGYMHFLGIEVVVPGAKGVEAHS